MTDGGRGSVPEDGGDGDERRYPASRLRPRTPGRSGAPETGRGGDVPPLNASPPDAQSRDEPLTADPLLGGSGVDPLLGGPGADPLAGPMGTGRRGSSLFAPKSFAGGRVQVFGCAPGFLIVSLVLSLLLTLLLNLL